MSERILVSKLLGSAAGRAARTTSGVVLALVAIIAGWYWYLGSPEENAVSVALREKLAPIEKRHGFGCESIVSQLNNFARTDLKQLVNANRENRDWRDEASSAAKKAYDFDEMLQLCVRLYSIDPRLVPRLHPLAQEVSVQAAVVASLMNSQLLKPTCDQACAISLIDSIELARNDLISAADKGQKRD